MANKVANVNDVTEAMGGIALADRTAPTVPSRLPAARGMGEVSARLVRSHLRRLPEAVQESVLEVTPLAAEDPLIETDTAPGFSALREVAVGRGAIADMCVDPASGRLLTANHADNSISMVDPETFAVSATVSDIDEPFAIAAVDGRAYVSTVGVSYDAITVVDSRAVEPKIHPLALSVRDIAASADGRQVYVARTGRDGADAAVVDTADGRVTTFDLGTRRGANAEAIAISPDGGRAYVVTADHIGGELAVIDTRAGRVVGGLAFDAPLRDVAVGADGATVCVASFDPVQGAMVDFVDAASLRVTATIVLGGAVTQLLLSAAGDRLYVVNGDRIAVVCTRTHEIIDAITVVADPSCIAESADGKRLFIADYHGAVSVLTVTSSTESLLAMLAVEPVSV